MIYYLYHGTYSEVVSNSEAKAAPVFHLRVDVTGDKYEVNGLSKVAQARLFSFLINSWTTDGFADAVEAIYSTDLPDNMVRSKVLAVTKQHYQKLFAEGPNFAKFKEVARSTPDLCLN